MLRTIFWDVSLKLLNYRCSWIKLRQVSKARFWLGCTYEIYSFLDY